MQNFKSYPDKGLFVEDGPNNEMLVCPYIKITHYGMNEKRQMLVRMEYQQFDGTINSDVIKCSNLLNRKYILDYLADNGFLLPQLENGKKLLIQYLASYQTAQQSQFVGKNGWLEDIQTPVYVRPDAIIGKTPIGNNVFFAQDPYTAPTVYSQAGTLEEWQNNIGIYLKNSPILTCAVCGGLGALIMKWFNMKSFFLNFYGRSSSGKTLALLVEQSLFSLALETLLPRWNVTLAGLESFARSNNDRPIVLDDMISLHDDDKKRAKLARKIVYDISNGCGKKIDYNCAVASGKQNAFWRTIVLSNGEFSFRQMIEQGEIQKFDGMDVRCIDIFSKRSKHWGIFKTLPKEFERNSKELVVKLEKAASKYYGTVSIAFLEKFVSNFSLYKTMIEGQMQLFLKRVNADKGHIKGRIAEKFAFLEAVGIFAATCGILPVKSEKISEHIRELYFDVCNRYKDDVEIAKEGIVRFRKILLTKKFLSLKKGDVVNKLDTPFGYRLKRGSDSAYVIRKERFDTFFESSKQAALVRDELVKQGIMPQNKTVQVQIKGLNGRLRYYKFDEHKFKLFKKQPNDRSLKKTSHK